MCHLPSYLLLIALVVCTQAVSVEAKPEAAGNDSAVAAVERAKRCESQGDFKSAIAAYEQAADLEPDNSDIQDALVDMCERAVKKDSSPESHLELGKAYQRRGGFDVAEAEYQSAISLSPDQKNPEAEKLLELLPDVQRFELTRRTRQAAGAVLYVRKVKFDIERTWQPPQHHGLLITKLKMGLKQAGQIDTLDITLPSGVETEDQSIVAFLRAFSFGPLPQDCNHVTLFLSFMSDGKMNMVDVGTGPAPAPAPTRATRGGGGGGEGIKGNPDTNSPYGLPSPAAQADDDFGPYMADVQRRIKRAWFPPKGSESKRVVVIFKIHRGGEVSNLRLDHSSGVAIADQAALKAVEDAALFRPLPAGAKDDVDIQFTFDYNVFGGGGHGVFRSF